jgi:hypothetical protein
MRRRTYDRQPDDLVLAAPAGRTGAAQRVAAALLGPAVSFRVKTFWRKPLRHALHSRYSDPPITVVSDTAGAPPPTPPGSAGPGRVHALTAARNRVLMRHR